MKAKIIFACCAIFVCFGCAGKPHVPPTEGLMYTSYNIWKHDSRIFAINFKLGTDIIIAGTAVYDVKVTKVDKGAQSQPIYYIKFKLAETGEGITVRFISRWHPGESAYSYKSYMFGNKTFEELTEGLTEEEISAIKRGAVVEGMSKRAVLVSFGRPPEHANQDLTKNRWVYWENKLKRKTICFDENEKAISCGL